MPLLRLARRPALELSPSATVMDAIHLMVDKSAGAVVVTEHGKLAGIFTERDVMTKIVLRGLDSNKTRLIEVMTTNVHHIKPDTHVADAITLMSENRIRHLPVVDENDQVLGMLSLRYLLHDRLEDLFTQLKGLEQYMTTEGPGG